VKIDVIIECILNFCSMTPCPHGVVAALFLTGHLSVLSQVSVLVLPK